ncbi:MAG: tetratricopeptide repeat protein [Caldilineaceae bacterium]
MTHITIRQTGGGSATPNAEISFDGGAGWPLTVRNPFDAEEEQRLAWYFEKWLTFPFTDQVKAQAAATSVRRYGETLFAQTLRGNDQIYSRYRQAVAQGVATLHFQIVGDPAFHALHWEALWDPDRPQPLTLDAVMIRSTVQSVVHSVTVQPSPTINLLLVTARPHGGRDVGYRTIQRPLVEMLRATQLPVQVDLVRPGSWRALVDHLAQSRRQRGVGHYHIIHFDLHGALLSRRQLAAVQGVEPHSYKVRLHDRYARPDLTVPADAATPDDRTTAWLFFEDERSDDLDAASAEEVAGLLLDHQIPIAILNACQSGQETGDPETGLGSRLLAAGVQTVVAMGYSVTVSAATRLMATLYQQLFQPPHDLLAALCAGRTALHHDKARRAAYNQLIKLEDWLLPVLYQPSGQTPRRLPLREMSFDEQIAFYSRLATRYTPPEPEYGFVGRDLDILQIEKRLLTTSEGKRRNLLLIQGMGGAGKSTLLRHLAGWWQTTGLVDEVFYFGYDVKAYHLQEVLYTIAHQLLNRNIPAGATTTREFAAFQVMQLPGQAKLLAQKLRSERHLLIVDNLESVTGDPLAIPNTLPPAEQAALRAFLADLLDGQTLVLLGSRGSAAWLRQAQPPGVPAPLRAVDGYALPGLDAEAAANLAERILHRQVSDPHQRDAYAAHPAFGRLLKLLDGSPLALEVVLSNLAHQTPDAILAALEAGDVALDATRNTNHESRTTSILACIDYAHSRLDGDMQRLLLTLFPFTGVIGEAQAENYIKQLGAQPALAGLPFERWPAVVQAAKEWGLLTPHKALAGYLRIQPVLPYFLKTRLAQEPGEVKAAMETAFRLHYADLAAALLGLFEAKEAQQRQTARLLTGVEYENLTTALHLSLAAQVGFFDLYAVLSHYLDSVQDRRCGIDLGERVLGQMEEYPPEVRFGAAGTSYLFVLNQLGKWQLAVKRYTDAKSSIQIATQLIEQIKSIDAHTKASYKAGIYHNLGRVAQEQRQWDQAEAHYQQALALKIELNDRSEQAYTYHALGSVAQAQQQWTQAEQYLEQALVLNIEFDDKVWQAGNHLELGSVALEQGQWAKAKQHYQRSLALYSELNDRHCQALTYHNLGIVAHSEQQWVQSEKYYQQALALKIEFNDRYNQASTYHQLGLVAQAQRQWTQAEQYFLCALALKIEFNDRYNQASTYHQLGRVAQKQQHWVQAKQHYEQALIIYIEFDDRPNQVNICYTLGQIAEKQQQWVQAEHHYKQALALYAELNARSEQADIYYALGEIAQTQQQWIHAEQYYHHALTITTEFSNRYTQARIYHALGRTAEGQQQWIQAEAHYQYALALCIEFNDDYHQSLIYYDLGVIAQAQQQWTQAEQHYQQAIERYIEFNERYWLGRAYHQLGRVAEELGQWQSAYDYFIHALALYLEFEDNDWEIVQRSLRRLWQAHPDETVLPTLAQVLGMPMAGARAWVTTAD